MIVLYIVGGTLLGLALIGAGFMIADMIYYKKKERVEVQGKPKTEEQEKYTRLVLQAN